MQLLKSKTSRHGRGHRWRVILGTGIVGIVLTGVTIVLFVLSPIEQPSSGPVTQRGMEDPVGVSNPYIPPAFDKTQHSATDPASLWVVVNKKHPLPAAYIPADLIEGYGGFLYSQRMSADLDAMMQAAVAAGVSLSINSAYRSYMDQQGVYAEYVARYGQAQADTISARAGHSEHQTGLALDINDGHHGECQFDTSCAGTTPAAMWLAEHAIEYGFIVRYTEANKQITGYDAEPWHLRYVGKDLTEEMEKQGITTLEEFFGISGGQYS